MTPGTAASPDAAVRPATPADSDAVAAVQLRAWRASYADALPAGVLSTLAPDPVAAAWRAAVADPPSARHRVLVSTADAIVTGFVALAPSADRDARAGDAEVVALEVDPLHRGSGHGSRLLNAAADTARELGFDRLQLWVPEGDADRAAFASGAGMAADGARRVRAADDAGEESGAAGRWPEVRLVSEL